MYFKAMPVVIPSKVLHCFWGLDMKRYLQDVFFQYPVLFLKLKYCPVGWTSKSVLLIFALSIASCTQPLLAPVPQGDWVQDLLFSSNHLFQGDQVVANQSQICVKDQGIFGYGIKVMCLDLQAPQPQPIKVNHSFFNDGPVEAVPAAPADTIHQQPVLMFRHTQGLYLSKAGDLIRLENITPLRDTLTETKLLPLQSLSSKEQLTEISALVEASTGEIYIADAERHQIFILKDKKLTVFAGSGQAGFKDGKAQEAQFNHPVALERDDQGQLFLLEKNSQRVRKIWPDGMVSTLAGGEEAGFHDGPGLSARFNRPVALAVTPEGVVFVADTENHRIRRIEVDGTVSTFVGNGQTGLEKWDVNLPSTLSGPRQEVAITPKSLALGPDSRLYFSSGQRIFRTQIK
jgi:sugar lactone lactonase YvrE